jgi:hypothetical protein
MQRVARNNVGSVADDAGALAKWGNQSEGLLHRLASPASLLRHRSGNRRSSACPRNSAHPSSALRQYLAADMHQFMAKIIGEPRLVIRMSGALLAVLDAKSSRNRPHLRHSAGQTTIEAIPSTIKIVLAKTYKTEWFTKLERATD